MKHVEQLDWEDAWLVHMQRHRYLGGRGRRLFTQVYAQTGEW